jgi:hypothetical protein
MAISRSCGRARVGRCVINAAAAFNSMRNRCQTGSRDLHVVLRRVEARSDGTNHLAIDDDRKPALHFRETMCRYGSKAPLVDGVLNRLARLLEQRRRSSLAGGKFHADEIGCMVQALDPPSSTTATTPAR